MENIISWTAGKKTYTVAFLMVVYAIIGFYLHQLTQEQMMTFILNALGFAGLRNGINKLTA
jgi:hypothetical protein